MANPSIESRLRALEAKVFIESLSPLTRSERRLIGDVTTPRGGAVPRVSADGEYVYDSDTDSFAAVGPFVEQSCHECRTVMCHVSTELGVKTPVLDECCCECHDRFWREHRRRLKGQKRSRSVTPPPPPRPQHARAPPSIKEAHREAKRRPCPEGRKFVVARWSKETTAVTNTVAHRCELCQCKGFPQCCDNTEQMCPRCVDDFGQHRDWIESEKHWSNLIPDTMMELETEHTVSVNGERRVFDSVESVLRFVAKGDPWQRSVFVHDYLVQAVAHLRMPAGSLQSPMHVIIETTRKADERILLAHLTEVCEGVSPVALDLLSFLIKTEMAREQPPSARAAYFHERWYDALQRLVAVYWLRVQGSGRFVRVDAQ